MKKLFIIFTLLLFIGCEKQTTDEEVYTEKKSDEELRVDILNSFDAVIDEFDSDYHIKYDDDETQMEVWSKSNGDVHIKSVFGATQDIDLYRIDDKYTVYVDDKEILDESRVSEIVEILEPIPESFKKIVELGKEHFENDKSVRVMSEVTMKPIEYIIISSDDTVLEETEQVVREDGKTYLYEEYEGFKMTFSSKKEDQEKIKLPK